MYKVVTVLLLAWLCVSRSVATSLSPPAEYKHEIFVEPNNPISVNNSSCYASGRTLPCADINFALAFPDREKSTKFILSSNATHHLVNNESTTVFSGGSEVAFYSDSGTAVVECGGGAGLAFINTTQITFNGVSFQQCGAWRDSTSRDFTTNTIKLLRIRVGLYFYNCADVTMVNMSVLNSTEAVGVVMYSTAGVNYIAYSHFDGNGISENNKNESGGGGFAVEFNYCKPGDNSCNETNHQTENNRNTVYTFEHCSFRNNRAIDQSGRDQTDVSILPHNETHSSLGRGGGLSLYFKGNATNNKIIIGYCYFEKNQATWGAGMIVEFVDSTAQTEVSVFSGHFVENYCYYEESSKGGSGGGARVATFVYYPSQLEKSFTRNSINFTECIFIDNRALFGGALSISFHLQPNSDDQQLFQAKVTSCSFEYNHARLGSAVSVDRDHYFTTGELGEAIFNGCSFNNNTIEYINPAKTYSVGVGALYISEISVTFETYMYFFENNGTALGIVGTTVVLQKYTLLFFKGNSGSKGGAIALLGMSNLIIGENTNLTFESNRASLYGGAIFNNYIGKEDLRSSIKCFLQYIDPFAKREKWETIFYFKGNKAGKLGQSIFSTTILPCLWSEGIHSNSNNVSDIFCWNSSVWVYENSSCKNEINTFPRIFKFSKNGDKIFPGKPFQLQIEATDDLHHNVSLYTVYTAATSNVSTCQVDPKYTYVADGYVGITGEESQNVTLELNTAGTRDWHLELNFNMERCPPGFILANNGEHSEGACDCLGGDRPYTFRGNLFCDKTNLESKIRNGYWIGIVPAIDNVNLYMGTTTLLHKYINNDTFPIARNYDQLDTDQCSHLNRKGPLCGECIKDHSTAVNSYNYECVPCTSNTTNLAANIAAYVSLTYLPYLIVFIVIIYTDVRLMSGPLVGFILYAQLIGSGVVDMTTNGLPYLKGHGNVPHKLQKSYRIVYGVFNLNSLSELMDPFCVRENFSALDVICLDYAVALFPLLLILIIYMLIPLRSVKLRYQGRGTNVNPISAGQWSLEKSLLHSFTGFIYLSYTKFTLTSTKILSTTDVFNKDGSAVSGINLVYYAGQYYFGQRDYILPYGLIAILMFIIFAVVLPILLLGPFDFMNWLIDRPRFQFLINYWPTLKINIFLDAFRGCYKHKCWYFTGIYFLFRLTVFIIYAFSTNEISIKVWQLVFLLLLIILVSSSQPYQVKVLNHLDVMIFFILAAINLISIYLYTTHISNVQSDYPVDFYAIGLVLIWLPMIYFLLYLLWHLLHKQRRYIVTINYLVRQRKRVSAFFKGGTVEERQPLLDPSATGTMGSPNVEPDPLTDSGMHARAQERNSYQPLRGVTYSVVEAPGDGDNVAEGNGSYGTASSGIASGGSTAHNGTGNSRSSNVRVTDTS